MRIQAIRPSELPLLEALLDLFGRAFDEEHTYGASRPDPAYQRRLLASDTFLALVALEALDGVESVVGGLCAYELRKFEQARSELYIYDLAVAAALVSALADQPTDAGMVFFGEIGLSGEVRMVAQGEARLKEAAKLGFTAACLPKRVAARGRPLAAPEGVALWEIGHLADLVARLAAHRQGRRASARLAPGAGSG